MINRINSGCAATTLLELVTVLPVHSAVKEKVRFAFAYGGGQESGTTVPFDL